MFSASGGASAALKAAVPGAAAEAKDRIATSENVAKSRGTQGSTKFQASIAKWRHAGGKNQRCRRLTGG